MNKLVDAVKNIIEYLADNFMPLLTGIILGVVFPLYCLLVNNKIQLGKLGDLGEWAGALATFLAVYVSLRLAADKKKMAFEVAVSVDTKKNRLILRIINTGSIPVYSLYIGIEAGIMSFGDFESPDTINVFEKKRIVIDFDDEDRKKSKEKEAEQVIDEMHFESLEQKEELRRSLQIQDAWDALTTMNDVEIIVDAGKVVKKISKKQIHYDTLLI